MVFFSFALGASSGNSGIWHTGFDCSTSAPLERQLVLRSNELAPHTLPSLSIPHPAPGAGALLVAWSSHEQLQLADVFARACANHCSTRLLETDELYEREPALHAGCHCTLISVLQIFYRATRSSHNCCACRCIWRATRSWVRDDVVEHYGGALVVEW